MDPPPLYRMDANGNLVDDNNGETRTAATVFFHVSPAAVRPLAILGGVGFGANDRPDLYLGGTLRILSPILLNAGVVWQWALSLPDDLRVGSPVSDPSILDTLGGRFHSSFFAGMSIAVVR